MLLFASTATPDGAHTAEDVARPPSPALLARHSASVLGPLPANVVMMPVMGSTRRTRSFQVSVKYNAPSGPYAAINAKFIEAITAGEPSPANPVSPLPAIVITLPVPGSIFRIRLL